MASRSGFSLTKVSGSGGGATTVLDIHRPNPNKQPIWNHSATRYSYNNTQQPPPPPTVQVEIIRHNAIMRLRARLDNLCKHIAHTTTPLLAMERWIARSTHHKDPVIPQNTDCLQQDLIVIGQIQAEQAKLICSKMQTDVQNALAEIKNAKKKIKKSNEKTKVYVKKYKHTYDIGYLMPNGKESKLFFKLNPKHYEKLHALFEEFGDKTLEFRDVLFVLLARYHAILGHGFQMALEGSAFDVLHKKLGVNVECFASPLNCWFPKFCSAFPDIEINFGSMGSFFDFSPRSGSFEVNPPFIAEIMDQAAERIEHLLKASIEPLSFCVVVPGWQDRLYWKILANSEFLRAQWLISKDDHGFCDGAQHQRQDRLRESSYDTCIFILQNESGAAKWPVSDEVEEEFRKSMLQSVPTLGMINRRLRSGRGNADADGAVFTDIKKRKKDSDLALQYVAKRWKPNHQ